MAHATILPERQPHKNTHWRQIVAKYERADVARSLWQVCNSFVPFIALWYLAYRSLAISFWLSLACSTLAAGFLLRIFIIFHDCTHGSFFKSQRWNHIVGSIAGVLTWTPYYYWRWTHSVHHATAGNLDKRGMGDVWTITVQEYLAFSPLKRLGYRLYRHPIVLFILGPVFLFVLWNRFSTDKDAGKRERYSVYGTNVALAVISAVLIYAVGWKAFLLVEAPLFTLAAVAGVWLFYVQHQFEDTYWAHGEEWDYVKAALHGSSFYQLPKVLQWFTGNIGYHHVHHLSPRIPNYKLEQAHEENALFQDVPSITLWSSLKAISYRMWDEGRKKLVGFDYVDTYQQNIGVK